jgi:hypothetical protein
MPFAEPRPHRHWFRAYSDLSPPGSPPLIVAPKREGGNLAITSLTASNQDEDPLFVYMRSRNGSSDELLLMALVPGTDTLHLPFPHPLMVGVGRLLVVEGNSKGGLFPVTVVGYDWVPSEDEAVGRTRSRSSQTRRASRKRQA